MPPVSDAFWKLFDDLPPAKKAKEKLNDALTEHVVEPLAAAGHPDLGAAIATVPSVAADFLAPSAPVDFLPLGAIVHKGVYPFKKLMDPKEAKALRESFDLVGGLKGKTDLFAKKADKGVARFDEDGNEIMDEATEALRDLPEEVDRWQIFHAKKPDSPVGVVDVDWSSGSPTSTYIENMSPADHKGVVKDFMEKFADRTGELNSSMEFSPTKGRYLGQELWEDRLKNVVEVSDDPDLVVYRMLSDEKFAEWLKHNPDALKPTKKAQ